ncbi:amino acid adenylation domain-containing protein [Aquamicrobium terrae]
MQRHIRTNLCHLIEISAQRQARAPAVTFRGEQVGYEELWRQVRAFAGGLLTLGLRRNDRVAIFLEKRIETVVAIFGTMAAGCVAVPANPLLKPAQVAYIMRDCAVRALVTSPERLAQMGDEIGQCPALAYVVCAGPAAGAMPAAGAALHGWEGFGREPAGALPHETTVDADMAAILYTSGSTGRPKGVVLSHRNMIVGAESVSAYLENGPADTILSVLPLSFDAGLSQLTTAFNAGAHVVLMNYLVPADVPRLCRRHRVTGITAVPPFWIKVAELEWPAEAASCLRYFANTGGRMPKATLDKLRRHFPRALPYLMYGLTEAFRSTYLPPSEVDRRPDSIGKAIPNAEIMVVRPDGSPCDPGEEGELVHRGPLVALGYWNDAARTAERFRPSPGQPGGVPADRAVFSGDTVVRDAEGFLYFVGRRDEMIKTSGYRVSPTEIEEAAYATGMVGDAVALGLDDAELGQRVVLVASPADGGGLATEQLAAALRARLPQYMLPSRIVEMAAIPTSPNGKFDRVRLRQELTRGPGGDTTAAGQAVLEPQGGA